MARPGRSRCCSTRRRPSSSTSKCTEIERGDSLTDVAIPPVRRFPGFPDRMELVPVPGAIFGTLLREIDDLAELKTLLHVLRLLHGQPKAPRFVSRAGLQSDAGLLEALGSLAGRADEAA